MNTRHLKGILLIFSICCIIYSLYDSTIETFTDVKPRKLAVIFSGRIKGYTHVENHLTWIKDTYNATFFISLNKEGMSPYIKEFCSKFSLGEDQVKIGRATSPDWIRSFDVAYEVPDGKEGSHVDNMYSMIYNINSAFSMIAPYQEKNNIQFDCIMFYRADIQTEDSLKIGLPMENTVYIPENYDWAVNGVNNQIAYGTYDTMSKYCSLNNNIYYMCKEQRIVYHPETLLKKHLDNEGLRIVRFPFTYTLHGSRHEYISEYDDYN